MKITRNLMYIAMATALILEGAFGLTLPIRIALGVVGVWLLVDAIVQVVGMCHGK